MINKKAAVITMGQNTDGKYQDILRDLPGIEVEIHGILDGLGRGEMEREIFPQGDEAFIVSNLADGSEVRIAERAAIRRANERITQLSAAGCKTALILCTGHFEPPQTDMTVLVPERIIPALLTALGVKRLGALVPEPEQIEASLTQYAEFNPLIRAASPYGSLDEIARTAALFRDEPVDMILTDCMGFTRENGELIAEHSGKQVFVPRVILTALLGTLAI